MHSSYVIVDDNPDTRLCTAVLVEPVADVAIEVCVSDARVGSTRPETGVSWIGSPGGGLRLSRCCIIA